MLKIINSFRQLDMNAIYSIYADSLAQNGKQEYPCLSENEQYLCARQDLYRYLQSSFFKTRGAFYALWELDGNCSSALRIEPYQDGVILTALQTAPNAQGKGFAKALVKAVIAYLAQDECTKIYSHIDDRNTASIAVHIACGFEKKLDHAVFLDGSYSQNASTYVCNL